MRWYHALSQNVIALSIASFLNAISAEMISTLLPIYLTAGLKTSSTVIGSMEALSIALMSVIKLVAAAIGDRFGCYLLLTALGYAFAAFSRVILLTLPKLFLAGLPLTIVILARVLEKIGKGLRSAPRDSLMVYSVHASKLGLNLSLHHFSQIFGSTVSLVFALGLIYFYGSAKDHTSETKESGVDVVWELILLASIPFGFLAVIVIACWGQSREVAMQGLMEYDAKLKADQARKQSINSSVSENNSNDVSHHNQGNQVEIDQLIQIDPSREFGQYSASNDQFDGDLTLHFDLDDGNHAEESKQPALSIENQLHPLSISALSIPRTSSIPVNTHDVSKGAIGISYGNHKSDLSLKPTQTSLTAHPSTRSHSYSHHHDQTPTTFDNVDDDEDSSEENNVPSFAYQLIVPNPARSFHSTTSTLATGTTTPTRTPHRPKPDSNIPYPAASPQHFHYDPLLLNTRILTTHTSAIDATNQQSTNRHVDHHSTLPKAIAESPVSQYHPQSNQHIPSTHLSNTNSNSNQSLTSHELTHVTDIQNHFDLTCLLSPGLLSPSSSIDSISINPTSPFLTDSLTNFNNFPPLNPSLAQLQLSTPSTRANSATITPFSQQFIGKLFQSTPLPPLSPYPSFHQTHSQASSETNSIQPNDQQHVESGFRKSAVALPQPALTLSKSHSDTTAFQLNATRSKGLKDGWDFNTITCSCPHLVSKIDAVSTLFTNQYKVSNKRELFRQLNEFNKNNADNAQNSAHLHTIDHDLDDNDDDSRDPKYSSTTRETSSLLGRRYPSQNPEPPSHFLSIISSITDTALDFLTFGMKRVFKGIEHAYFPDLRSVSDKEARRRQRFEARKQKAIYFSLIEDRHDETCMYTKHQQWLLTRCYGPHCPPPPPPPPQYGSFTEALTPHPPPLEVCYRDLVKQAYTKQHKQSKFLQYQLIAALICILSLGHTFAVPHTFLVLLAHHQHMSILSIVWVVLLYNSIYSLFTTPAGILSDKLRHKTAGGGCFTIAGAWMLRSLIFCFLAYNCTYAIDAIATVSSDATPTINLTTTTSTITISFIALGFFSASEGTIKALLVDVLPEQLQKSIMKRKKGLFSSHDRDEHGKDKHHHNHRHNHNHDNFHNYKKRPKKTKSSVVAVVFGCFDVMIGIAELVSSIIAGVFFDHQMVVNWLYFNAIGSTLASILLLIWRFRVAVQRSIQNNPDRDKNRINGLFFNLTTAADLSSKSQYTLQSQLQPQPDLVTVGEKAILVDTCIITAIPSISPSSNQTSSSNSLPQFASYLHSHHDFSTQSHAPITPTPFSAQLSKLCPTTYAVVRQLQIPQRILQEQLGRVPLKEDLSSLSRAAYRLANYYNQSQSQFYNTLVEQLSLASTTSTTSTTSNLMNHFPKIDPNLITEEILETMPHALLTTPAALCYANESNNTTNSVPLFHVLLIGADLPTIKRRKLQAQHKYTAYQCSTPFKSR